MSSKIKESTADWSWRNQWLHQHRDEHDDHDGDVLETSEITQPTDGSLSEDGAGGWLGSIGVDFRNMAVCFKESTLPVLGGMASLVHNTAMTVAAEIAQLERDSELDAGFSHSETDNDVESLFLPWEIQQEHDSIEIPVYVTDEELMDKIMALSLKEATFSSPFASSENTTPTKEDHFLLDGPRVVLIRRLLDVDENLAAAHSRLSGRAKMHEYTFWKNYFHHCEKIRNDHIMEKLSRKNKTQSFGSLAHCSKASSGMLTTESEDEGDFRDDSSLVPVSGSDDSSYVLYPAPCSGDSFSTTRSFDDMVLVSRGATLSFDEK